MTTRTKCLKANLNLINLYALPSPNFVPRVKDPEYEVDHAYIEQKSHIFFHIMHLGLNVKTNLTFGIGKYLFFISDPNERNILKLFILHNTNHFVANSWYEAVHSKIHQDGAQ